MVSGLGAGVGLGVGEEGDGSATLRSGDEVQPERAIRPERANRRAKTGRMAKKSILRSAGMRGSPKRGSLLEERLPSSSIGSLGWERVEGTGNRAGNWRVAPSRDDERRECLALGHRRQRGRGGKEGDFEGEQGAVWDRKRCWRAGFLAHLEGSQLFFLVLRFSHRDGRLQIDYWFSRSARQFRGG